MTRLDAAEELAWDTDKASVDLMAIEASGNHIGTRDARIRNQRQEIVKLTKENKNLRAANLYLADEISRIRLGK